MRVRARALAVAMGLGLAGSLSTSALAMSAEMEAELLAEIKKIRTETAQLRNQVKDLTGQVNNLKQENARLAGTRHASKVSRSSNKTATRTTTTVATPAAQLPSPGASSQTPVVETQVASASPTGLVEEPITTQGSLADLPEENLDRTQNNGLGSTVTTSPYIGIRSQFDGSDLIVNLPTMNEDLRLLQQKQEFANMSRVEPFQDRPIVELSGKVEGQVSWDNFGGGNHTDIDLSGVELDTLVNVSPWAFGYVSLLYDNSPFSSDSRPVGPRIANSNIFLRRGFLTIGNLNKTPFYFTIGQMYVPFGRYASSMVSDPITRVMARTNQRAVVFGYSNDGLFAQAYAFRGDTRIGTSQGANVNEGGFNLGYQFKYNDKLSGQIGAGIISNLSDSMGIQNNGGGFRNRQFSGFGRSFDTEFIHHRVPGIDIQGSLTYGPAVFIAEFISATRAFDRRDLSYNNSGANLRALHLEADYNTTVFSKPTSFGVAFDQSWQALALRLPQSSVSLFANTSIWKNTIQSLEYRHNFAYANGSFACGRVGKIDHDDFDDKAPGHDGHHPEPPFCPPLNGLPIISDGKGGDAVIFQIGVYW